MTHHGESMRRGQCTFRPDNEEDRHNNVTLAMDNAIETILLTEAHITGTRLSLFPNFVETQTRDAAGCTARNWEFLAEIVTRPTRAMHAGISQPRHVRVLGEPS